MDEEILDAPEVLETPEETVEETDETPEETVDERDTRIAELEEKNKQLFERAKKAETAKKVDPSSNQLSPKDFLALNEHKVSSDDFDEVIRVSTILGKPLHEALKDTTLQTILNTRAEERRTASATQTGRTPRGTSKTTGADLLTKAESTGELPDSDAAMQDMIRAKMERTRSGK